MESGIKRIKDAIKAIEEAEELFREIGIELITDPISRPYSLEPNITVQLRKGLPAIERLTGINAEHAQDPAGRIFKDEKELIYDGIKFMQLGVKNGYVFE